MKFKSLQVAFYSMIQIIPLEKIIRGLPPPLVLTLFYESNFYGRVFIKPVYFTQITFVKNIY